jgi:hypothetical protein
MKPKNFTYLELCKANGYGLTYGLMDMGLEVQADIQADGTGLTMLSHIYLYIDEPTFKYIPNLYYFYDVH